MHLSTRALSRRNYDRCAPVHTLLACQYALRGRGLPAPRITHLARTFALPPPPPAGGGWFPEQVVGGQQRLR